MNNLKLSPLSTMNAEALSTKDLQHFSGGSSPGENRFTVDSVYGTIDSMGVRKLTSFATHTFKLELSDEWKIFINQWLNILVD